MKGRALRIIAGRHRGRRLKTIEREGTRPMTDRVRESLFNIIAPQVPGSRFIDLFAGSGAVGLEALSRGASMAVFVEMDRAWSAVITENIAALGEGEQAQVLRRDVYSVLTSSFAKHNTFDIVFAGAPYDGQHHQKVAEEATASDIMGEGGMLILQYRHGEPLHIPTGWQGNTRTYGITDLTFLRRE